jgi:hypothetical protein
MKPTGQVRTRQKTEWVAGHTEVEVYYRGKPVFIDEGILSLMKACWRLGIRTEYCCQGEVKHGYPFDQGYISFPTLRDAQRFINWFGHRIFDFCTDLDGFYIGEDGKKYSKNYVVRFAPIDEKECLRIIERPVYIPTVGTTIWERFEAVGYKFQEAE